MPIQVSPSEFPDPIGLLSNRAAVARWQVVCNIAQPKGSSPRCCVSFSAYYNESIIPCQTCACRCSSTSTGTCSANAPALLLPSQALLIPLDNRTQLSKAWAGLHHFPVPNPLPCADYRGGWSARITIFNWEDFSFADWFAAVELDKAAVGFEKVYSFNESTLNGVNSTIIMQGMEGLNYLVAEADGADPQKDFRMPGKQQSVISFTKKNIPGIDIPGGDGFPTITSMERSAPCPEYFQPIIPTKWDHP